MIKFHFTSSVVVLFHYIYAVINAVINSCNMKSPKIRYYLEPKRVINSERNSPELIMSEINYGYSVISKNGVTRNKPFRYSLEAYILPKHFGEIENNFKFNKEVFAKSQKNNATIRTKILKLETALIELENNYEINGIVPSPDVFKKDLKIKMGREKKVVKKEPTILEYLYHKIGNDKKDTNRSMKSSIEKDTIKTYVTVSHLIENYQIATKEELTFQNFDKIKYWKLWDILDDIFADKIKLFNPKQPRKQRKNPSGYTVTAIRKYQKTLLKVLKDASKDGISLLLDVHDENLVLEDVEPIKDFYIDENILKQIIETDLEFDESLQIAKEYFIVGSLTGMRFQSMNDTKFTEVEIYEDENYNFNFIHSKQKKTSTEVCIPLLNPVLEIIEKYNKFPDFKSNSTVNTNLKKLFKHFKIDRLEKATRITYRNGTIITYEPLSKLISSHDCKRTFYSNLTNRKVLEKAIDNITHPDKAPKNAMGKKYNKTNMLDKAKIFVDEILKIDSHVYRF